MKKKMVCISSFKKDGLVFLRGEPYDVEMNPVDGRIYVFTPDGRSTYISKSDLDWKFL